MKAANMSAESEFLCEEDDLEVFRSQWRRELDSKVETQASRSEAEVHSEEDDIHKQARDLFMQGVEAEQEGRLYEAISFYKKAEKLVPNIELQAYTYSGKVKTCSNINHQTEAVDDNGNVPVENEGEENDDDGRGNRRGCLLISKPTVSINRPSLDLPSSLPRPPPSPATGAFNALLLLPLLLPLPLLNPLPSLLFPLLL